MKPTLPVTAAAVRASTTVEAAAPCVEAAAAVKASTEARLPARGESSGDAPMVQATERTRMWTSLRMRRCESMLWCCVSMLRAGPVERRTSARHPAPASATKPAGVIGVRVAPIEVVAIDEDSTVGYVGILVV